MARDRCGKWSPSARRENRRIALFTQGNRIPARSDVGRRREYRVTRDLMSAADLTLALYEPDIAPNAERCCAPAPVSASTPRSSSRRFRFLGSSLSPRWHGLPRRAGDRSPFFVRRVRALARDGAAAAGCADHRGKHGTLGLRVPARRYRDGRAANRSGFPSRRRRAPTRASGFRFGRRCARSTSGSPPRWRSGGAAAIAWRRRATTA